MRQLISRIDDDLHRRLRAKAAADDRSLNDLVTEALQDSLDGPNERAQLLKRLAVRGIRVVPPRPAQVPTPAALKRLTKGAGTAVSAALAAERHRR